MNVLLLSILICIGTIFICMNILSYQLNRIVLKHENDFIKRAKQIMKL